MVAIIIPYYKLTFFEETLRSLANQTDKRFKVYIGEDASLENPTELLEKYKEQFNVTYKRFESNLGGISLTQQWERCIALSGDEDWIMILGDDDVLGENVVEAFYNNIEEINVVGANVIKFASQTNDVLKNTYSKIYQHSKLEDAAVFYFKRFKGQVRSSLSEHIFKREVYLRYGFKNYPLGWHSDDYAWLSFAENKPIYCINEATLKINISSKSITGNSNNEGLKKLAESLFFMNIIQNKLQLFSKEQRLELLYQAEVSVKNTRKLSFSQWNCLAKAYIYNFSFISSIKFMRRFLIQILR